MHRVVKLSILSILLRALMIGYGCYHDARHAVKYTDIDYQVFTEAATFMSEGKSPYQSPTYRYTPLLAFVLLPNIFLSPIWGKIVFSVFDVVTGYLLYRISRTNGASESSSLLSAILWLFNPVCFTVSTRGNAEAILASLVLAVLYFRKKDRVFLSAVFYGLAVHSKIYPIIYALPLYINLGLDRIGKRNEENKIWRTIFAPNKSQLAFVVVSASVFLVATGTCYVLYGHEFLSQTYLYHVGRKDIRHNFSLYYLMIYLTDENALSGALSLLAFLPQCLLLLKISLDYHRHLELVFFVNTAVFVTFNKVVTSQYFIWYLSLLPLLIPYLNLKRSKATLLTFLWSGNQCAWLLSAYLLEFRGKSTFVYILLASIAFFLTNCYIIRFIIKSYRNDILLNEKNEPTVDSPKRD